MAASTLSPLNCFSTRLHFDLEEVFYVTDKTTVKALLNWYCMLCMLANKHIKQQKAQAFWWQRHRIYKAHLPSHKSNAISVNSQLRKQQPKQGRIKTAQEYSVSLWRRWFISNTFHFWNKKSHFWNLQQSFEIFKPSLSTISSAFWFLLIFFFPTLYYF